MRADLLHVFVAYSNHLRWRSRLENFRRSENHLMASGVKLTTIECAPGDRPFDLPDREGVLRIRLRSDHMLWQKENQLDIGFRSVDFEYGAYVDGDCMFLSEDWAAETVHALQIHRVAQISSHMVFLGPKGEHVSRGESITSLYHRLGLHRCHDTPPSGPWGYPGLAWAFRRDVYEALHGLLDICVLGSADYHMARGLLCLPDAKKGAEASSPGYLHHIDSWQKRAAAIVRGDVAVVPGTAAHFWHGSYETRAYETRPRILIRHRFDPDTDLVRDRRGLLRLAGNKPDFRDDLRAYFASRNEDASSL